MPRTELRSPEDKPREYGGYRQAGEEPALFTAV
jgi:hypothetical protein